MVADVTVSSEIVLFHSWEKNGPIRFSYNPYFSACFFSQMYFSLTPNQ
jgi:hypothetical protein